MLDITCAATRAAVALLLGAAMAGCSSSNSNPAGPSGGFEPEQFLRPGEYRLLVFTTTQQIPSCTGQSPNPFFAFTSLVRVTQDGETWTARAAADADGDVELRLRRVADNTTAGSRVLIIAVEGTGRGTVAGTGSGATQTLFFAGESRLAGSALFQGSAQGTATGTIRLNSPIFGPLECPAVSWTLVPGSAF